MKHTKRLLLSAVSVLALSSAPALFAQDHRDDAPAQRAENRDQHAAEYHFRQEDAPKLRQHYKNVEKVDVAHRQTIAAGAQLPADWHRHIRPVPVAVVRELPAPPAGYVFGYYDGYCVVYDPATGLIADVIDLATLPH
jgi:Ni/Co efflux regulator RcnB